MENSPKVKERLEKEKETMTQFQKVVEVEEAFMEEVDMDTEDGDIMVLTDPTAAEDLLLLSVAPAWVHST